MFNKIYHQDFRNKESEVKEIDSNKDSSCNKSNDVSEETNESITSIEESSETESGEVVVDKS